MLILLSILVFLFAILDARITARRMEKYGPKVELNSFISNLSTQMGSEGAALIGIMIPNAILIGIAYSAGWKLFLAGLVGFKLRYFWNQLQSLRFEKQIKEAAKLINSRPGDTPPSSVSESNDSAPPSGPPFKK